MQLHSIIKRRFNKIFFPEGDFLDKNDTERFFIASNKRLICGCTSTVNVFKQLGSRNLTIKKNNGIVSNQDAFTGNNIAPDRQPRKNSYHRQLHLTIKTT
jgi:hypothetical protein